MIAILPEIQCHREVDLHPVRVHLHLLRLPDVVLGKGEHPFELLRHLGIEILTGLGHHLLVCEAQGPYPDPGDPGLPNVGHARVEVPPVWVVLLEYRGSLVVERKPHIEVRLPAGPVREVVEGGVMVPTNAISD